MSDPKDYTPEELKRRSRGHSTDMSPEAIERRLDLLDDLYKFAMWLSKGKKVSDALPADENAKPGQNA